MKRAQRITLVLTLTVLAAAVGYLNGNILVFTTPPVQVCVGWPDDAVFSWVCTPDYTAKEPR